jgi:Mg2+-importing ATPase
LFAVDLAEAAGLPVDTVVAQLASSTTGLGPEEAHPRLEQQGPNAVRSHGARPLGVLARQVKNPLLVLLVAAALVSLVTGEVPGVRYTIVVGGPAKAAGT